MSVKEKQRSADEAVAIRVAKAFLEYQSQDDSRYLFSAARNGDEWVVLARRVRYDADDHPMFMVGGHRIIVVGEDHLVKSWQPGE